MRRAMARSRSSLIPLLPHMVPGKVMLWTEQVQVELDSKAKGGTFLLFSSLLKISQRRKWLSCPLIFVFENNNIAFLMIFKYCERLKISGLERLHLPCQLRAASE